MPARREYTAAELRVKLAHERELSRVRSARYRARHGDAVAFGDGDCDRDGRTGHRDVVAPPQTPPVVSLSSPSEKEKEAVARAVLRGFRERGYRDDARIWALWRQRYPEVDLELEVFKLAEWLREPRNERRKCSKGFLDNWFSRAAADQKRQTEGSPPTAVSPKGVVVVNGTPYPPSAFQRNLEKTYKAPEDYTSEDLVKSDEARRRVLESLPARLRGKWHR